MTESMTTVGLRQELALLRTRLDEANQTIAAFSRGEIDAVVDAANAASPILLRAAQDKLRQSERLFRAVFDGATDALLLFNDHGMYVDANPAACALFALSKAQLVGRNALELCATGCEFEHGLEAFLAAGHLQGKLALPRAGCAQDMGGGASLETELDFRVTARILPGLHLSVLRDMTSQRRVEKLLRQSEASLEEAQAVAHMGSWVSGMEPSDPSTWSRECYRIFGVEEGSAVSREFFFKLVHPDDLASVQRALQGITEEQSGEIEHRILRADGEVRWVQERVVARRSPSGNLARIGITHDITERRRAEEVRNRLASIVESSDDAIISKDAEGQIVTWNGGAERLFGYSAKEVLGKGGLLLAVAEGHDEESSLLQRVLRGERVERELPRLRKDKSLVEISLMVSPLRDAEGQVVGASEIARDLTERKRASAELKRTEEQLRQAQKMETVGALAAGIAHDFNNLLLLIVGSTSLVLAELKPHDPLRLELEQVLHASEKATSLVRQLLAFSRQQLLQPVVVDVHELLAGLERMLRRMAGEKVELVLHTEPALGRINADPRQIEQVMMNLVVNARDAMPCGGKLAIDAANVTFGVDAASAHVGVAPGSYVRISIADAGTGMTDSTRARMFEPFFTTKKKGKGAGLGLSIVLGIVQQSGGYVTVKSEPEQGTSFSVYLPRTDREPEVARVISPARSGVHGTETILLVEDEPQVRAMTRRILEKKGYKVLEAESGSAAFALCEQYPATIHLLLTDMVMPQLSGREVAAHVTCVRPGTKVLFMSGYSDDAELRHGLLDAELVLLQKPFMPEALASKVRDVLDGRFGFTRAQGEEGVGASILGPPRD